MLQVFDFLVLLPLAFPLPLHGRMMIPPLPDSSSGQENENKVKVEIFYESLCPDSKNFFVDTLEPSLSSQLNQYISITLVPYGKAHVTIPSPAPYQFSCQHGPLECEGNKYHNCAQKYLKNQSWRIKLTTCMFKKVFTSLSKADWSKVVEDCSEQLGLSTYLPRIQKCAGSLEGSELLHQAGVKTGVRNFIPTVVLSVGREGEQMVLDTRELVQDFKKKICDIIHVKLGKIIQPCQ